jgi:hypothetical protein
MQDGGNLGYRARIRTGLDRVVHSKTFINGLVVCLGVGFAGLAASIGAVALDDYGTRSASLDRAYSSLLDQNRSMGSVDFDSPPLLPLKEPVDEPAPDVDLELAVTTDDPRSVIASAAKSILRQDGKRYRVTVTVESTPNGSNERKL